ncbi:MAG TPA: response regulator transcription factor, partial [Burkholderiaceae bacterium]|nr:response regulator transcription factor [Burkholderiaceae bacterium]
EMLQARLLLIDDHTLFRSGLRLLLSDIAFVGDVLEASSVIDAVQQHGTTPVDLILLDIQMPGLNGLDAVPLLQRYFKSARILIVSGDLAESMEQAARTSGVQGYLPKSAHANDIEIAIQRCLRGERHFSSDATAHASAAMASSPGNESLTPRQLEVLAQLCLGRSNKAIAYNLGLSENTVRVHVAAILARLNVSSRSEAMLAAQRAGLIQNHT